MLGWLFEARRSAMKRIALIALIMLIGGYEAAAHAQADAQADAAARNTAGLQAEEATIEVATTDFLGLKWGTGIGVMGRFGGDRAVEKASIDAHKIVRVDEEGDLRPQLFLEMHMFLTGPKDGGKVKGWREYQQKKARWMANAEGKRPTMPDPPHMGFGPFIAVQSSDDSAIDALALGVMWGFRTNVKESNSANIGIGLSFDPSVQVLGGGLKEDQETSEEAVRFKKEGRFGWALMTSFTF